MRRFSLLLLAIIFSLPVFGQKKQFTNEPKDFAVEIKSHFLEDRTEESKLIIERFLELWEANAFSTTEQAKIVETSNKLLKERMRVNPDFRLYFTLLNTYKENNVAVQKFNSYHQVLDKILAGRTKDYRDFTSTMYLLFRDLSLFDNGSKKWQVSNSDYTLSYEDEPVFTFPALELQLFTKEDTMGIYQTKGKFLPMSSKWIGESGTVYWTRVGLDRTQAHAKLKRYTLDLKSSEYAADSVQLTYPKLFPGPLLGRLEDRANTTYQGEKSSYPKFKSYQSIFTLKNVFPNIDYKGGFSLEGKQILGTGTDSTRASITIYYDKKPTVRALSNAFVINPEDIVASKAAVSIYLGEDSIYHTQLIFNYQEKNKTLTLSREPTGLYASPFFDSYHQLEIQTGNIIWKVEEPMFSMKTFTNPGQASIFESGAFFAPYKYSQVQGILDYNPLDKLKRHVDITKRRKFTEDELEFVFNNKIEYLRNLLFLIANEGYIFYDLEGKYILVKDKLVHYVNSAKDKDDYDRIFFESVISAIPNATVSLLSYDLTLEGVPRINLSDSQKTYIVPTNQKVIVKKDLDMVFDGMINSGRFDFYGVGFYFDYKKFLIKLTDVDSVKFHFPEYDENGRVKDMRMVQNSLQDVNGFLYIDQPFNKSGRQVLEEYPIFECNKESFVYYDRKSIFGGVYRKENFYFKIDPFTIKRLDDFTAEDLQFPGNLISADILPVYRTSISIQEDFSLGFINDAPAAGFTLYRGKGTGKGVFKLSNKGLRADGEVNYLASYTKSNDFLFFPDSMNSQSQNFDIPDGRGKYPPVAGKNIYTHWMPYQDSMFVFKKQEPLSVYNGKINFDGNVIMTPKELVGTGNITYQNMALKSKAFALLPSNVTTKDGDLVINSVKGGKPAIEVDNITGNLDLNTDISKFETNADTSRVFLKANRFSTTLNRFTYDMGKKEIQFVKRAEQADDQAVFVSTNPEMQSLKFQSKNATMSLEQEDITAMGVPDLIIADSRIFTPEQKLVIDKAGGIATIEDADIVTDLDLQYHKIYDATINVFSSMKFTGFGSYDYIDKIERKFVVQFNDVRVNDAGKTTAKGRIADSALFFISPGIQYSGNIALQSNMKELAFDGAVMPDHKMPELRSEWVKMADTVDPKNVVLKIPQAISREGRTLYTGTFVASDSTHIYNVLFGQKKGTNDHQIFSATGSFMYDEKTGSYNVGPINKLVSPAGVEEIDYSGGNLFKLTPDKNAVYTEGIYNMGADLKHIELTTAGSYNYSYADTANKFKLVMLIDFPIAEEVTKVMIDTMLENSYNQPEVQNNQPSVLSAFAVIINDAKERTTVINEVSGFNLVPLTKSLQKKFVLTDVTMTFSRESNSFISVGDVGLANIQKSAINKQIGGVIEIRKSRAGDKFSMVLESARGSYHYYSYQNNMLSYMSSDYVFLDLSKETGPKVEKEGQGNFNIKPGTVRDVMKLKTRTEIE